MTLGTGLLEFAKTFPKRFYDVGISEQHAATFASGLASQNLKPVFAVYSTFLQRAFDQMIHDIALQNLPVILAIDRAGLVGADGPTHHGAFDLSYLRHIPNWVIASPKDGNELRDMLYSAISWQKCPVAIRYPRSAIPDVLIEEFATIDIGTWESIKRGKDVAILAVGSTVYPALEASHELEKEGIGVEVVNARFVKPLDEQTLASILKRFDKIITVEENVLSGGFGSAVLEFAEAFDIKGVVIKRMGIPDEFIEHGSRDQLLSDLGLDKDGISQTVKRILQSDVVCEKVKTRKASS